LLVCLGSWLPSWLCKGKWHLSFGGMTLRFGLSMEENVFLNEWDGLDVTGVMGLGNRVLGS
jgi:hypothetical protein